MKQDFPRLTTVIHAVIYIEHVLCLKTYHGCGGILWGFIYSLVNVSYSQYLDHPLFSEVHVHANIFVLISLLYFRGAKE